jgi:hypothetical protein
VLYFDAKTGWVAAQSSLHNQELKFCWLPKDRRGSCSAVMNYTLAVGAESGAVTIMSFDKVMHAMLAMGMF